MDDQDRRQYYRPVPGSRELVTSSAEAVLGEVEKASETLGLAPRVDYRGEWLGGVEISAGATVPDSVFDDLAPRQSPLEQTVYLHLFRLSYGRGKNFARVGKRELTRRARLSDRRLNVALDGLVEKGHVKPLHRSVAGTLYRVYLPSEVLGRELEPGVRWGEQRPVAEVLVRAEPKPGRRPGPPREKPLESPLNEEAFAAVSGKAPRGPAVGEIARSFFSAKGRKASESELQLAVSALTGLLEDGFSRQEAQAAVEWWVKNMPGEESLDRLAYYIDRALSGEGP